MTSSFCPPSGPEIERILASAERLESLVACRRLDRQLAVLIGDDDTLNFARL